MTSGSDPLAAPPPPPPPPPTPSAPPPPRRTRALPWVIGFVAGVAVAALGFTLLDTEDDPTATPQSTGSSLQLTLSAVQGRCLAPDVTTLAQAQVAFRGSVTSVSGGTVTLDPSTWYAGRAVDHVTVTEGDVASGLGAVDFRAGHEYFVAANSGHVMVCGFSGEQSSHLASLYAQAFPGATS